MKFYLHTFVVSLLFAAMAVSRSKAADAADAAVERPLSAWRQSLVWPQHRVLRQRLIEALRNGDVPTMEKVCREAVQLIPGDATWHYNLACALSYRETPDAALEELSRAVDFGFRNAQAIEGDKDFKRISKDRRFKEIVERARSTANIPVPGRPLPTPAFARFGGTATLTETNVVWNIDEGFFHGKLKLTGANVPSPLAERFMASRPGGPERPYVVAWLSEGTAAGNGGDIYMNRDRNHSSLKVSDFPLLTTVRYTPAAVKMELDVNHPNMIFPERFTIANASRARVGTPLWRSLARASLTEPDLPQRMNNIYMNNQLMFFPAHKDYGVKEIGDVFPAVAPFQFVSQGSSWSDLPLMRAALSATASFHRIAKESILRRHLGGPTMQWLMRRSIKGVKSESDYLSPKAHPTVFTPANIDVLALVKRAHALKPNEIPPAVGLSAVNSWLFPIRLPLPGRDYSDVQSEFLFAVPCAIGIVIRGTAAERSFMFNARTLPEKDPDATFAWRVVHGPADAVKIETPLGETVNDPEHGLAQVTLDVRRISQRIDIAVFAKTHGTEYGAPSFISFYPIPFEKRIYDDSKRIVSIDNFNQEGRYCDPLIALPRRWKDEYRYAKDGSPLGFVRSYLGQPAAEFITPTQRIVEKNPDGTPKTAVHVKYISRKTGDQHLPLELTYIDDGKPFAVAK